MVNAQQQWSGRSKPPAGLRFAATLEQAAEIKQLYMYRSSSRRKTRQEGFRLVLNDALGNALERRPPPPAAVPLPRLGSLRMPPTEDVQQQLQVRRRRRRRRQRRCGLGTGGVARALLTHRRHHLPQLPLGDDDLDADAAVAVVPSLLDGFRGPDPGAPRQDSALHGRLGLPLLRLRFSHLLLLRHPTNADASALM
ncbi:hypothetical protein MUK42_25779 [Musa troglodytarum]|uniref:Uncharacterized protein n=1 Tax=Musa troglodytarum TaxID=320322 RepID=A0A9E7H7N1_9LILI|nr:hypothetical protein MUK42_25779 [Musa troglodytarum]